MPQYEYDCMACAIRYVKSRSILDNDPGYLCESCNKSLVRVYSNFGVQFKGDGFYSTDNGRG
jgi:putative FmdB family regulatory protein